MVKSRFCIISKGKKILCQCPFEMQVQWDVNWSVSFIISFFLFFRNGKEKNYIRRKLILLARKLLERVQTRKSLVGSKGKVFYFIQPFAISPGSKKESEEHLAPEKTRLWYTVSFSYEIIKQDEASLVFIKCLCIKLYMIGNKVIVD